MAAASTPAAAAGPSTEASDLRHQVFEGQLNKFTNVVRGWQYRWFVVRPETGMLDYHLMEEPSVLTPKESGSLKVSGKCRGSQHLAGCIVVPSDEDSLTFNAIFASGETYKLRASNVRERQVWVDRLRAVAQLHEKAIAHTHPPVAHSHSPPPPPPGVKSQLTARGEPTESLQNLSLSVLEAFGSVHDILHQADLKHMGLRDAIEQLPMHGPKPSCLDDDMLTVKATSQAALICMQEALSMLQEIVEGSGQAAAAHPSGHHQRKPSHKFLMAPLSPHRKSSRSKSKRSSDQRKEAGKEAVGAASSSATTTPRLSMNSGADPHSACEDQASVASETSSSYHDSLAS